MKNLTKLKSNVKVYVGIPWLRNDHFKGYLGSCLNHLAAQETSVEVMEPELTAPYSGSFKPGEPSLLYAIMDRMNAVIDNYLKTDATHCLIVDADVELPPHAVEALIMHNVDIATGVYPFHNFEQCRAMMFGRMTDNPCGFFAPRDWNYMKGKVMGVDEPVSGGTGCMMIKRRVFRRYHPNIPALRFSKKDGECGADVYFWKRAQDMGFTARLDANIVCGHLPEYPLREKDKWLDIEEY